MLVNPFGNLSWLGLSISFGTQKEGNLFPLVPNGVCFGSDKLISDGSSTSLGRTNGFWFGRGHVEGNPPQWPFNLSASIRSGSRRVEVGRIICLLRLFGRLGTHVIWDRNDESHQSRLVVKQSTFSIGFGKRFQTACHLEYLGFWIPINRGALYFLGHLLAFSHFGVSLPALHIHRHCVCHQSFLFAFLIHRYVCHQSLLLT